MSNDIQLRGHCQCCGNFQAVPNGRISKHGYTVQHGWFSGVCNGQHYAPIEQDRSVADKIVSQVLTEVHELNKLAANLKSGAVEPKWYKEERGIENGKWRTSKIEVTKSELSEYEQHKQVQSAIYAAESRARAGESFAQYLLAVAEQHHGKPLAEVKKPEPTKYIQRGDQKLSNNLVLTAQYQERARVYYTYTRENGKVCQSWIGTQAWRKLPDAA